MFALQPWHTLLTFRTPQGHCIVNPVNSYMVAFPYIFLYNGFTRKSYMVAKWSHGIRTEVPQFLYSGSFPILWLYRRRHHHICHHRRHIRRKQWMDSSLWTRTMANRSKWMFRLATLENSWMLWTKIKKTRHSEMRQNMIEHDDPCRLIPSLSNSDNGWNNDSSEHMSVSGSRADQVETVKLASYGRTHQDLSIGTAFAGPNYLNKTSAVKYSPSSSPKKTFVCNKGTEWRTPANVTLLERSQWVLAIELFFLDPARLAQPSGAETHISILFESRLSWTGKCGCIW